MNANKCSFFKTNRLRAFFIPHFFIRENNLGSLLPCTIAGATGLPKEKVK